MRRVTFLLPKDPFLDHGGDVTMSRLMMELAREAHEVRAIALSRWPDAPAEPWLTRVAKPPVRMRHLVSRRLSTGRSLVHLRFDVPALTEAVDRLDSDLWGAEHNYMAESWLASTKSHQPLVLSTHVPESSVWAESRPRLVAALEQPRLERDELRVARRAQAVGTFDEDEARYYTDHGVTGSRFLDVTLRSAKAVEPAKAPPRLIFVGTRDWPPNQRAFETAVRWWPEISRGIPGAELVVAGSPKPGVPPMALPPGVRDLGFVDDLDGLLASCRGMVAPITTGGGVRVKLLHAAAKGLPVVGTVEAVGSLEKVLGITPYVDRTAFVDAARRLLLDPTLAGAEGERLWEVNHQRWEDRRPHLAVESLLSVSGAQPAQRSELGR